MNLKYKINDLVYYYNNESLELFTIQSITLDEFGVVYNIVNTTNNDLQLIAKEDELFTKLNEEINEHYMLYPVSIRSTEKCGRGFNLYEKYYDEIYVYKIKSAEIGILRPTEHQYPSYIDYECELVGKIKTNILKSNNITIPKVIDDHFFKIDAKEHNQLILEFNKLKSKLLNFVDIYYIKDYNNSHRLIYQKCMDGFILSINPNIRDVVKSIDSVVSLETSYSNYVVVDDKIVSREPLESSIIINYLEVGSIQVDIKLLDAYKQDSEVLPDLYVYCIENIRLNYVQLQKIIIDKLLLEFKDIEEHSKNFSYKEIINHKINQIICER